MFFTVLQPLANFFNCKELPSGWMKLRSYFAGQLLTDPYRLRALPTHSAAASTVDGRAASSARAASSIRRMMAGSSFSLP